MYNLYRHKGYTDGKEMAYETSLGTSLEILKLLNSEPRHSIISMMEKLDLSRSSIKMALLSMTNTRLVKTEAKGLYVITDLGREVLKDAEAET